MNQHKVEFFRHVLNSRLKQAAGANSIHEATETPLETMPDQADQASYDYDRNVGMRIRDREVRLIKKIKQALERLDEGTYGLCEECGEHIPEKRLEARPVTTQCVECKDDHEKRSKAFVES